MCRGGGYGGPPGTHRVRGGGGKIVSTWRKSIQHCRVMSASFCIFESIVSVDVKAVQFKLSHHNYYYLTNNYIFTYAKQDVSLKR